MAAAALLVAACGKKGPPLPPLVLLPSAPTEFSATRRAAQVDLTFKVPGSNTDSTAPADVVQVDVYAWTAPEPAAAADVVRLGARLGSIVVNEPIDEELPEAERPPRKPGAVDQDAVARVADTLSGPAQSGYRSYVVVGVNRRGRRGALSARIAMPLGPPPAAPGQPTVTYDEQSITVSWAPVESAGSGRPFYALYRSDGSLVAPPVRETQLADKAIEWGAERCYQVRTVSVAESVRIESGPSPERCVTLRDTFPPKAPVGLLGVAAEATISLIWTANAEADLRGYLVLRAIAPSAELVPVTPVPTPDTNFRDTVPPGARVTYAIQAVDTEGNRSAPSESITETAR